jgi:outer membrane lipoprotein-sorting protein
MRTFALVLALFTATAISAQAPRLEQSLAALDKASAEFHGATADVTSDLYEAVTREHTVQHGAIFFLRKGSTMEMGSFILAPGAQSKERVIAFKGGVLEIFDPRNNQIQQFKSSAGQADMYLTLGFGGSGKDLTRAWNVTDDGAVALTVDGKPMSVEKLELVSKDAGVRQNFSKVTLWLDLAHAVSVKQLFDTPSGDSRTATYTHIHLTDKIDTRPFAIKRDHSTTVITH